MYFIVSLVLIALHPLLVRGSICSVTGSGSAYNWQSPDYPENYPNEFECTYPGTSIGPRITRYTLTVFELQEENRGKCLDKVIFGKPYHNSDSMCGNQTGQVIEVAMGASTAMFTTNTKKREKGFSIDVTYVTTNYTQEYVLSSSGTADVNITSPEYPKKIENHMAEYWITTNEAGKKIQLDYHINIKKEGCCDDFNIVYNPVGDPTYPKKTSKLFCGIKRSTMVSKDNKFYVTYHSAHAGYYQLYFSLVDA